MGLMDGLVSSLRKKIALLHKTLLSHVGSQTDERKEYRLFPPNLDWVSIRRLRSLNQTLEAVQRASLHLLDKFKQSSSANMAQYVQTTDPAYMLNDVPRW